MSDKPAVIAGWFTNVSFLTKIDVARVTIEIPKDLWEEYQLVLGVPPSVDGAKKYVAVTRITEDAFRAWAQTASEKSSENGPGRAVAPPLVPHAEAEGQDKPRTPKYRSNIAAVMIKENKDFQAWLVDRYWGGEGVIGDYDALLKRVLKIGSKKDLDTDGEAAARFDSLRTDFELRDLVR